MEILTLPVGDFIQTNEFIIPAYQRPYMWSDDLLEGLWSDLGEMYTKANAKSHYIGVLLSSRELFPTKMLRGAPPDGEGRNVWSLVDGQQRLVTTLLLLAAIRDSSTATTAAKARALLTQGGRPRLIGQEEDRVLLSRILTTDTPVLTKDEQKTRIGNAYAFFKRQISGGVPSFWKPLQASEKDRGVRLVADKIKPAQLLSVATTRLSVTDMVLDELDQSAPAVFDAINGKRRELEPVDLLRNTVFAELDDIPLFTSTWARMESESRRIKLGGARLGTLPLFIDSYLHSIGESASQHRLARRLNELILDEAPMSIPKPKRQAKIRKIVGELVTSFDDFKVAQSSAFGGYEGSYESRAVRALDNVSMLSSGPPLPLSLLFLRYRRTGFITPAQLLTLARLLEGYLGRRIVCGVRQQLLRSHLSSVTSKLIRQFGNESTIGSKSAGGKSKDLAAALVTALNSGSMQVPSNTELRKSVRERTDMNKLPARQRFAILRRLNDEIAGRHIPDVTLSTDPKGPVNFSIEHVFPQSFKDLPSITQDWLDELRSAGQSQADIRALIARRDNLGNYTLVHQNRALGRKAFLNIKPARGRERIGKRKILADRGLEISDSVVRTTRSGAARTVWDVGAVQGRSRYLATLLVNAYPTR